MNSFAFPLPLPLSCFLFTERLVQVSPLILLVADMKNSLGQQGMDAPVAALVNAVSVDELEVAIDALLEWVRDADSPLSDHTGTDDGSSGEDLIESLLDDFLVGVCARLTRNEWGT